MSYGTTEETATRKAAALVVQLGPDKWKRNVWENLGWCYCARLKANNNISVTCNEYPDRSDIETSYTCYFNSAKQFIGEGSTPGEALQDSIEQAQHAMNTILEDVMLVQEKGNK